MSPIDRNEWDDQVEITPDWMASAPYDFVVSFLKRFGAPGDRVFEVGFGSGANLQWAAEHGFHVGGIEASALGYWSGVTKIGVTHHDGDGLFLQHGILPNIEARDNSYDLIIDRACLSYVKAPDDIDETVEQLWRIARPGAYLLFNPYSYDHSYTMRPEVERYSVERAATVFKPRMWDQIEARRVRVEDMQTANERALHGTEGTLRIVYRKRVE